MKLSYLNFPSIAAAYETLFGIDHASCGPDTRERHDQWLVVMCLKGTIHIADPLTN